MQVPYAKALLSIDGDAYTAGARAHVASGATVEMRGENISQWEQASWEIFSFPAGWAGPAGVDWSFDTAKQAWVSGSITPSAVVLPASTVVWGKWLLRLVVNNGVDPTTGKGLQYDPAGNVLPSQVVDISAAWSEISPNAGLTDIGVQEGVQFHALSYVRDLQATLRVIDVGLGASGGTVTMIGDVTGSSSGNTVGKINHASVPAAGGLTAGNVLQVSGAAALTYAPVNLAGGVNYVTGALPVGNVAYGTAGQFLVTNAGPTAAAWASISGDITASVSTVGQLTVAKIQGVTISGTPAAGSVLQATSSSAAAWTTETGLALAGEVTGTLGATVLSGPFATATLQWVNTVAPTLGQLPQTTDAACSNLTIAPQAPYASATGGNRVPGNLAVNIAAPSPGGTTEGTFSVTRVGGGTVSIGRDAFGDTALWMSATLDSSSPTLSGTVDPTYGFGAYLYAAYFASCTINNFSTNYAAWIATSGGVNHAGARLACFDGLLSSSDKRLELVYQASSGAAGTGGDSLLAGGVATGNGNGGNLTLRPGAKAGGGTDGTIQFLDSSTATAITWVTNGAGVTTQTVAVGATYTLQQAARTTDAAPKNLTIQAQGPYASAATNVSPGNTIINIPAPISGTFEGGFLVTTNTSAAVRMGYYSGGTSYAGIWFRDAGSPTDSNFGFLGNQSVTYLNNPTQLYLTIGGSSGYGLAISGTTTCAFAFGSLVSTANFGTNVASATLNLKAGLGVTMLAIQSTGTTAGTATLGLSAGTNFLKGAYQTTVRSSSGSFAVDTTTTDHVIWATATQTITLPAQTASTSRRLRVWIDATGGAVALTVARNSAEKINGTAGSWGPVTFDSGYFGFIDIDGNGTDWGIAA